MYCSESVALDSRAVSRLCIDLKNDSWVAGGVEVGMTEVIVDDEEDEAIGETVAETEEEDVEFEAVTTVDKELADALGIIDMLFDDCGRE